MDPSRTKEPGSRKKFNSVPCPSLRSQTATVKTSRSRKVGGG